MGMNCHKCGTLLPAEAAYCPACGAPRSEIEHFVRETERAVLLALTTGTEALDRAAKDLQPAFEKAVQTLRPAVEAVGKATNDVVVAMTPMAEATVRVAKEVADKTVAAVKPAGTKATGRTGNGVHKIRGKGRAGRQPRGSPGAPANRFLPPRAQWVARGGRREWR